MNDLDFTMTLLEQDLAEMSKHIYINAGNKRLDQSMNKDFSADEKYLKAEHIIMHSNNQKEIDTVPELLQGKDKDREDASKLYRKGQRLLAHGNRK